MTPAKRRGGIDEGRPTATCLLDHPDCLHDFVGGEVYMLSAAFFDPGRSRRRDAMMQARRDGLVSRRGIIRAQRSN